MLRRKWDHIFVLILNSFSICITKETIWMNATWQMDSNDITCSVQDETICVINCAAPYSCGSHAEYYDYPSFPRPQIVCPSHASSCIINCIHEGACSNSVIRTGECNYVEINVHNIDNNEMTINAPTNGDLFINIESDEAVFDRNVINAHDTNQIFIDCNGKGSCQKNQINAESIAISLDIACRNGANCDGQEIHCPDNNKPHVNPKCSILCDYHRDALSSATTSCSSLNIFAMNGTNQKNGIYLDCDARDNAMCDGSTVYCRRDGVCHVQYDEVNREWYCEGLCGGRTSAPTFAPTAAPTSRISTKTESSTTKSTNHMWFMDPPNATLSSNEILTVIKDRNYKKHNLEVLAYILMGCLIGVICFCVCIICIACWLVEKRLKIQRMQSNTSNASTVSYEYYGAAPPVDESNKFGNTLFSGVKSRMNAIASLTASISNGHPPADKIQDNEVAAASDEQLYSRNPPPYHEHVINASPSSIVSKKRNHANKERSASSRISKKRQRRSISSYRKQSGSSSSSASSLSTSCEEVCSESDASTTYDEYGNNFNIAIKSTRPMNETEDGVETQSIAISVNTGKSSRDRTRNEIDDEKACELLRDECDAESTDSSYDDETCTECTLCNGHKVICPQDDDDDETSDEEDLYNAYDDGYGSNDNKRYRIEVSGPEETMSPRRTTRTSSVKSNSESQSQSRSVTFLRPK